MEYDESRPYLPGDDIRQLDWRVTARTGRPHTKMFREERERPVLICVDFRRAMFFATRGVFKAVQAARAQGVQASDPIAPDTVFMRARAQPGQPGEFDVVLAMYHDQGLIPVKYLGVEKGVNVTLGLPIIRTSVDHGTALELAGTGRAVS